MYIVETITEIRNAKEHKTKKKKIPIHSSWQLETLKKK